MSCVAVATSPALAACHSPSVRHRDDPGIFGDVRPSQLVTCLDLLPPSPLLFAGGAKLSTFLSSCKSSPCHSPMPPPSPRVQCSPRTPSWTSPSGRSSLCLCGGLPICSCSLSSASPSDSKWRPLEKRYSMESLSDVKYGFNVPSVEPRSPRLSSSPCSRYSRAVLPPHSALDAPSPRVGTSHPVFASPRAISRPTSANAKIHPTVSLDECGRHPGDGNAAGPGYLAASWNSSAGSTLDLPKGRDDAATAAAATESLSTSSSTGTDVAEHNGLPSTPPLKRKRPPKLEIPPGANLVVPSNFLHVVDLAEDALNDMTVEGSYYGICCKKGRRETLEDTQRAVPDLHGDPGQAFFGVFDGHGGRKAADFAAENMVQNITDAMDSSQEGLVEDAVRAGYLATDAAFLQKRVSSGASCVTANMMDGHMVVANAGDCRAVLSRTGVAEALTCDHRAGREDERQRIEDLGGFVDDSTGTWRVQGTLAVSRGIGDLHLKEWVTAEPEVRKLQITPDCEFLILASDGLWDAVTNQEAVDIARALLQSERMTAEAMDLQIPLAMASSSLSKRCNEQGSESRGGGQCQGSRQCPEEKNSEMCPELQRSSIGESSEDTRVLSTKDNDEVEMCVGTMDADVPNVGFPEPRLPSVGPVAACRKLVEMSAQRGCHDDISVLIVNLQHFQRKPSSVASGST